MKNKDLLSFKGAVQHLVSVPYLSRVSLDSILSRLCLASLICLCMMTIGVGKMWGADETLTITGANSGHNAPWGTSYGDNSGSSTTSASNTINLTWTQVGRMNTGIQIAKGTSNCFYSTTCPSTNNIIKSINITMKTNSANLYGSTDGKSWTSISFTSGTEKDVSASKYKYFKVTATSKYCVLTSIVVTYTSGTTCSNKVTISKGSESNGTFTLDKTGEQNACDALSVTVTPLPATHYHVASVSATNPTTTGTAGTAVDNGNGTWTITYSANAKGASTVNVTFEEDAKYTINYHDGSGTATRTNVYEGTNIIDALGTPAVSCDATSTTFMGWSTTQVSTKTNTAPTYVSASAVVNATTAAAIYYAVYAKSQTVESGTTTILSEPFSGFSNNSRPTSPGSSATKLSASSISYSCSPNSTSGTRILTSGGPADGGSMGNNIIIQSNNGYFQVSNIPTNGKTSITLSYRKSGGGTLSVTITSPAQDATIGTATNNGTLYTHTVSVPSGTTTFALKFTNTNSSSNLRFDDLNITVPNSTTTYSDFITTCAACTATPTVGDASLKGAFNSDGVTSLSNIANVFSCASSGAGDNCSISEYGFVWSSTASTADALQKGKSGVTFISGSSPQGAGGSFTGTLSDTWVVGTTYYYRSYVKNNGDNVNYSSVRSFIPRSVTFNSNGGSAVATKYVISGGTVTAPTAPTKTGYTFGGWYQESGLTNAVNWSGTIDANKTYYAKWTKQTYTITSELENATSSPGIPSSYEYTGSAANLSYTISANSGYRLPTTITVSGTTYTWNPATGVLTLTGTITGNVNITITAVQTHTVTWYVNGAAASAASLGLTDNPVVYDHGASLTLPTKNPSVPGGCSSKVFIGWTAAAEITTETGTKPTLIEAGGAVNTDVIYRAVFADEIEGDPIPGDEHTWNKSYSDWGVSSTSWLRNNNASLPTFKYTPSYSVQSVELQYSESNTDGSNTIAVYIGETQVGTTQKSSGTSSSYATYTFTNGTALKGEVKIVLTNKSDNTTGRGTFYLYYIKLIEPGAPGISYDKYITLCSSCTTPSNLVVSPITGTSGKVTWDGVSLSPTEGFKVAWSTGSTRPATLNATNSADVAAGTNEYTISGLTPATRYYVWVQSKCNSEWSSSTDFFTNAKITYAAGTGATGSMSPKEVTYDTDATVDACTFTAPSSKTFAGWTSDVAVTVGGSSTTSVEDGATITGLTKAITLTAQWRDLNTWTIHFHVDNGTVVGGTDQTATENGTFTFPDVTSTSCGTFIGWITGSSYESTSKPGSLIAAGGTEDIALGGSPAATDYYAVYAEVTDPAPTQDYVKIECEQDDWSGQYLIVSEYTVTPTDYVKVFNGGLANLDASGNNVSEVTITSKKITADATTNGYSFTIAKIDDQPGKYSIYSSGGHYIGCIGKSNNLDEHESTVYQNTISYDDVNLRVLIYGSHATEPCRLAYNNSTGVSNNRFRYYANPDSQKDIQLYKKGGGKAYIYKTSPSCTATLRIDATALTEMTYVYNAGPSASQTFTAGGKNMTENKIITISAPENFQVSKDNSAFSERVECTVPVSGELSETVYIRLTGGLNAGTYGGAGQVITVSTDEEGVANATSGNITGSVTKAVATFVFTDFNAGDHYEAEITGTNVAVPFNYTYNGDGAVSFVRKGGYGSVQAEDKTYTLNNPGIYQLTASASGGTNYTDIKDVVAEFRVKRVDTYVDFIHNKAVLASGSGTTVADGKMEDWGEGYTVPYIADESEATSGSCQQTHYKFMGWVSEDEINIVEGTFKDSYTLITAGTVGKRASTKTYYAVWAKLED